MKRIKAKKGKKKSRPVYQDGGAVPPRKLEAWETFNPKNQHIETESARLPNLPDKNQYTADVDWTNNFVKGRNKQFSNLASNYAAQQKEDHPIVSWVNNLLPDNWRDYGFQSAAGMSAKMKKDVAENLGTVKFKDASKIDPESYVDSTSGEYMPFNHSINFNTTPGLGTRAHEIGHATRLQNWAPARDLIYKVREGDSKYKGFKDENKNYLGDPGEIYSRVWGLRREWDVKPTDVINKEYIKKKLEEKGEGSQRLFEYLNEDSIIKLMNELVDAGQESSPQQKAQTGAIVDPLGQWAHPGQVTTIPGNQITMQGVNYPVMGVSNTGHRQLMKPGKNYNFEGDSVTEYPLINTNDMRKKQSGGSLSGPVLRSGPNVKNSKTPKRVKVTKAPGPYAQTGGKTNGLAQSIGEALQQGQTPDAITQSLVQKGFKPQQAQQLVQQVIQQMQGTMQTGGTLEQTPANYDWSNQPVGTGPQLPILNPNQITPQQQAPTTYSGPGKLGPTGSQPVDEGRTIRPFYTGNYNLDRSIYSGARAKQLRGMAGQEEANGNPDLAHQDRVQASGNDLVGVGSGIKAFTDGIQNGVGIVSSIFATGQARKLESEQQYWQNRKDRAQIDPYRGNDSSPALSQTGGDFDSANPNVITERGETITDPTKGPIGPDGRPTGVVVHDNTGDNHTDSSGGNAYNLGEDSVVHSKMLGIRVGDFLASIVKEPNAAYIASKIAEKYKNPDKEVSFAQLAKVFDTTDLVKQVDSLAKKAADMDKKDIGRDATDIAHTTQELNKKTIGRDITMKQQEMSANTEVTGVDGPIHNLAELLKTSGAYGSKVKNQEDTGELVKLRGKKMLLPKAQMGRRIPGARARSAKFIDDQNAGALPAGTDVDFNAKDEYNDYLNSGGQWYYNNGNVKGALVPQDKWGALDKLKPATTGVDATAFSAQPPADPNATTVSPTATGATPPVNAAALTTHPTQVTWPDAFSDPSRTAVKNFYNNMYMLNDDPRNEQKAIGLDKGFNTTSWGNDPLGFMKALHTAGFTPTDWNNVDNKQVQKFLLDTDAKQNDEKYSKLLYDQFLNTNHGLQKPGVGISGKDWKTKPWDTLTPEEKDEWLVDGYNGVRTDLLTRLLQPKPTAAQQQAAATTTPSGVAKVAKANLKRGKNPGKIIYQEGLAPEQIAGDMAALVTPRDPVPYIEDQGAKDALSMTTKQQYANDAAEQNRMFRQFQANTQYNPQNQPAVVAQNAANLWTAQNESSAKTRALNAQIQKGYEDQQVALRDKAGTNKAKALDKLAERTATSRWKKTAMDINAISDIGNKRLQNRTENRTAALYQGMFKNAGYDPLTGAYIGNTSGYTPAVGGPDYSTQLMSQGYSPMDIYRIQHGMEILSKGEMEEARGEMYNRQYQTPSKGKQTGGKVKRMKRKSVKY